MFVDGFFSFSFTNLVLKNMFLKGRRYQQVLASCVIVGDMEETNFMNLIVCACCCVWCAAVAVTFVNELTRVLFKPVTSPETALCV